MHLLFDFSFDMHAKLMENSLKDLKSAVDFSFYRL
jgi:hypothetical protein